MTTTGPAYDDQNVFARILRGELPAYGFYDDEHAIGIMDLMPQGEGHCLVIPKAPSRNLLDIGAHDLQNLMVAVQRVARAVLRAFDAEGVTIMQFNELAGGQTVFHTHFHVIPRFPGVALQGHSGRMADGDALAEQAFRIKAVLAGAA